LDREKGAFRKPALSLENKTEPRGRPRRLKVLNLTFTVLFMNDAQMAGTGAVGYCDPETQTIGLVGSQSDDSMQDTFLHEVFHAIVHVMDLEGDRDGRKLRSPLGDGTVHGVEQQPFGVQVVEWVGLVACGFQFLTRLATVFCVEWRDLCKRI
jgi:hypothetical protein